MRCVIESALVLGAFAAGLFPQNQDRRDSAPAPKLTPKDFTPADEPLSLQFTLPFRLYVNGREHPVGWHLGSGRTMWLGIGGRGGYTLSLIPCYGYGFKKSGAVLDHKIVFESGGDQFELRFSGPIAGSGKAWNRYVLHEPLVKPKTSLFETYDWDTCYPSLHPLVPE